MPWVKKLRQVEVFLSTPSLTFTKHDSYSHRVLFGEHWLTVPTQKCSPSTPLSEVRIVPGEVPKLAKSITNTIGKRYAHREQIDPFVQLIAQSQHTHLYPLVVDLLGLVLKKTGTKLMEYVYPHEGVENKTDRLIQRLQYVQLKLNRPVEYVCGEGTARYLELSRFPFPVHVYQNDLSDTRCCLFALAEGSL